MTARLVVSDVSIAVFDVSHYINDHPGGADIFAEIAGADGSEAFDNAQHSEDAMKIKTGFCVGRLEKQESQKRMNKLVRLVSPNQRLVPKGKRTVNLSLVVAALLAVLFTVAAFVIDWIHIRAMPMPVLSALGGVIPGIVLRYEKGFGFVEGVLFASITFLVLLYLAYRPFHTAMEYWTGQWRYKSHLKLDKLVRPSLSDQRGWLDPSTFQKLPLARKETLGPNTFRFVFKLPKPDAVLGLPVGQHVSVLGLVNGKTIARSYTPTSSNADRGRMELVVRCYDNGALTGGYLRHLQIGDEVAFRGPKGGIRYRRGMAKKLGMVAGGSGITPMYQLIRSICEDARDTTEVSLLYANRTEADILLRKELDRFASVYSGNFRVWYVLDDAPAEWQGGRGFVTRQMMAEWLPAPSAHSKVAICGPPGMVEGVKKSLGDLGYGAPGAITRAADKILCF